MKNVTRIEIPAYVCAVMDVISRYEMVPDEEFYRGRSYVVGGCVRDALLGRKPNDWDVATNCRANDIMDIFSKLDGFEAYPTGIEHGTVTVISGGMPIEVTTFRSDTAYIDHRHPSVVNFHFTIDCDLERRDFTINAIAYSHESGIIDLYGGKADLENKLIRCVGNPEMRFSEDALRILRALRFASVLGFDIEEQTAKAVIKRSGLLMHISAERITSELEKLLGGKAATDIIREFSPVFDAIFPALADGFAIDAAEYIQNLGDAPFRLKLAALISDVIPERIIGAFMHLRLDNKTRKHVESILRRLHTPLDSAADIKRLCRDIGADAAADVIRLGIARSERDPYELDMLMQILKNGECYTTGELKITGGGLLDMGAVPREIGGMLDTLLEYVIGGELTNDTAALEKAAERLINRKEII